MFEQALSIVIILLYVCIWHAYIQMDILVLVHFLTVFIIRIYAVCTYVRTYMGYIHGIGCNMLPYNASMSHYKVSQLSLSFMKLRSLF